MFVPLSVVPHHLNAETRQPLSAYPLNGLIGISEECARFQLYNAVLEGIRVMP